MNSERPNESVLFVHSREPFNAEPRLSQLQESFVTPQASFYIRSHGAVPEVDEESYRLVVCGNVDHVLSFSLQDLKASFQARTVMATMQCAGNRRADMMRVRPVSGDPWIAGAIGNARWTGVRLADVLRVVGVIEAAPTMHVAFDALDECEADGEKFRYGASIPLSKALSPDVLLAWAMNDEPLLPEHGFPLRLVVPGFAGVRSPKWLAQITVQDSPSDNHIQARDYKLLPPDVTKETVDWKKGITINELPLNSAICDPSPHSCLAAGEITLRGWAMASARAITRVDVSADGGRNWFQAELEQEPASPWCWTFWRSTINLAKGEHELVVRAWDSAGQTQPSMADETWNFKGYLSAAWHRVSVKVA
jgi:sulfite oxidase